MPVPSLIEYKEWSETHVHTFYENANITYKYIFYEFYYTLYIYEAEIND